MDKVYLLITLYYTYYLIRKGMVLNDGNSYLDHLFQKSLCYNHHKENYKISQEEGVTPTGFKLRKDPAFLPVTDSFQQKWDAILFNAERNLVELLLVETDSVIKKLELDIDKELKRLFPNSIEENRSVIKKKHQPYKKQLSRRRRKK